MGWRVYDVAGLRTREDITARVLAAVAAARRRKPARGFVIAR
ncbi:hypothetical protein [Streptomyces sp. NBC_01408]|nr:hypothetical protein [Streptomyces sp. NBC_01408]MCX4695946.1 hypothetical protein [Streptomyces sp. NBC_01408]